ncbi:MAG: hypothetical protein ACJATT_004809 [Myxococcota bacterium]
MYNRWVRKVPDDPRVPEHSSFAGTSPRPATTARDAGQTH